jgi:hypothetical protein
VTKKRDSKFQLRPSGRASVEEVRKTIRKSRIPKFPAKPVKVTPLVEFMIENEEQGKTSRELIEEFRKTCGHDYKEIAYLVIEGKRHTYQGCAICGNFIHNRRRVNAKEDSEQ